MSSDKLKELDITNRFWLLIT